MFTHSNPFAQGGWNAQFKMETTGDLDDQPSIFGALPINSRELLHPHSNIQLFRFTSPTMSVLNSVVTDSQARTLFKLASDPDMSGYTTLKDGSGKNVALIEWKKPPMVEIRGSLPKVHVRDWLKVHLDQKSGRPVRTMAFKGMKFTWVPHGEFLHVYPQMANRHPCVVIEKSGNVVTMSMTSDAIHWGLFEPCIVAVTLLLSGRRLE